jgi:hypothetical protein
MNGAYSETFFMISSVGFIVLFIVLAILLYYLIKAVRAFKELTEKIERNIDTVGYASMELIEDLRSSAAFRLLFKPRRRHN